MKTVLGMVVKSLNLRDLSFLVADSSKNFQTLVSRILRGFGVRTVMEAESGTDAYEMIRSKKVDVLFCDVNLPNLDGFALTKKVRSDPTIESRTLPIFVLTSHTQPKNIHSARDAGANMVIAKPVSPNVLFDRLHWVAGSPRPFVDVESYFGPDRRFKIEGFPDGVGRRAEDVDTEVGEEEGPALSQEEIDSLFNN